MLVAQVAISSGMGAAVQEMRPDTTRTIRGERAPIALGRHRPHAGGTSRKANEMTQLTMPTGSPTLAPDPVLWNRIEMDVPWPEYGGGNRGAQEHYPLIRTTGDILHTIEHARFADGSPAWRPDPAQCHLWLWVTSNYLPWGLEVMGWLGFRYVRDFVWVKTQMGLGQYARGAHELCLFGTMGETRMPVETIRSDFGGPIDHERDAKNRRIHSRKPRAILDQIDRAYPSDRGLEMFARTRRPGVRSWGNETDHTPVGQMELIG